MLSSIFRSPVAFPAVVRVHFTVQRDHIHYFNFRVWFVRLGFFQPATISSFTPFAYRQPPACSLDGLNRIRRVIRLAPCKLVIRKRVKFAADCRLGRVCRTAFFPDSTTFPIAFFTWLASSSLFSCRLLPVSKRQPFGARSRYTAAEGKLCRLPEQPEDL